MDCNKRGEKQLHFSYFPVPLSRIRTLSASVCLYCISYRCHLLYFNHHRCIIFPRQYSPIYSFFSCFSSFYDLFSRFIGLLFIFLLRRPLFSFPFPFFLSSSFPSSSFSFVYFHFSPLSFSSPLITSLLLPLSLPFPSSPYSPHYLVSSSSFIFIRFASSLPPLHVLLISLPPFSCLSFVLSLPFLPPSLLNIAINLECEANSAISFINHAFLPFTPT